MAKVVAITPRTVRNPPAAPKHLQKPESDLWHSIVASYDFDSPASLALLLSAMEAAARCRQAREAIDRDGLTMVDRFGRPKIHPAANVERDSRVAFVQCMKALSLDL